VLTELQPFIGRFHPLLVHLPIGFLLLAGAVEALSRLERFEGTGIARLMPALLGVCALSTAGAIATGLLLSSSGDYDAALVGRHQQWGLMLGAIVLLACVAAWWRERMPGRAPGLLYGGSFGLAIVLVGVTGHLGGSLTHGEGYLTEHLPTLPFLTSTRASATPGPVDPSATPVFRTLVAPMLEARCVGCHGPARQAGKLRLDSPESIRKGGEDGAVIVPGNAMGSLMVRRIFLPTSDKKAMPPRGHPAPSHADVALLRWWIDQGASFDQVLADTQVTPELEPAIADRLGPVDLSAPAILSVRVPAADDKAIGALKVLNLRVEPLRAGSSLLMVEAPPAARTLDDAALASLDPLAAQIAWLNLGGTQVTDTGITRLLPKLVNLWKLSLDRTAITDRALAPLEKLTRLESINVYGTAVTDAGLKPLEKLPRLRSVYAWQTQVTTQGAEALQASVKNAHVNIGAPPTPLFEAPAADEAKTAKAAKKKAAD
jgi:uncharacterized membrane protein